MGHHRNRIKAWQACQQEIGAQIRNMRLELDLPPQIAAELLHIGLNQLLYLENGYIGKMQITVLHSIAYKYNYKLKISFEKKLPLISPD